MGILSDIALGKKGSDEFRKFVANFVKKYTEKTKIKLAETTSGFSVETSSEKILSGKAKGLYTFQPLDIGAVLKDSTSEAESVCKSVGMKKRNKSTGLLSSNYVFYKINGKSIYTVILNKSEIEIEEHENNDENKKGYTNEAGLYNGAVTLI